MVFPVSRGAAVSQYALYRAPINTSSSDISLFRGGRCQELTKLEIWGLIMVEDSRQSGTDTG